TSFSYVLLKVKQTTTNGIDSTLTFQRKNTLFPRQNIIEIAQLPALNILERAPEYIVGVMNLRGKIISVIDIRKFLGIPQIPYTAEDQVMIIQTNNKTVGIIVNSVNDVIKSSKDTLEPLPYESEHKIISGLYKASDGIVAFLDLDIIASDIASIKINQMEYDPDKMPSNLFPTDKVSLEKFKKALNLQKELKVDIEKDLYQDNRFVSFSLNNEIYCVNLKHVRNLQIKTLILPLFPACQNL
ncbi:MAG: chemotaxis protein CheW, partial [Anaerotruncus sp.]|nr:chemotaxis protein CheW [Anaerotruncus sp.]